MRPALPPGLDCCCGDPRGRCPAPLRCGWWPELCCNIETDEQERDCWPATGRTFGPGSTVTLDIDVILAARACNFYRCETPGPITAAGLYDVDAACGSALPRATSGDEVAVAWHARKRLLKIAGVSFTWAPSDPVACTGFGWRATAKIALGIPGSGTVIGEADVWDECEQVTIFQECNLDTELVECDLVFTPALRGGWSLSITRSDAAPFAPCHALAFGLVDGGGTVDGVAAGGAEFTPPVFGGPSMMELIVSVSPSGCLWSWEDGLIQGRQVFGEATESGTQASGIIPPAIPSSLSDTSTGTARATLRAVDITWKIARNLVADSLCGYDCDHLPYICRCPSTFVVTIEHRRLGGLACEGGCRSCLITCTTVGTLSWCAEDQAWVYEIVGQDGTIEGGTLDGCRKLEGGVLVPIVDPCDGDVPEFAVSCQRDPTDLVAGPYGWLFAGWEGTLTPTAAELAFQPFASGACPTGSWEITTTASWCPDSCGASEPVELYSRLTIE